MAKDIAIDPHTRDIAWPIHYISGKAEVAQALLNLILTPKGTFLNYPDVGMDYTFLIRRYNPDELRLAVRNAILEDQRVVKVNQIHIKTLPEQRSLVYVDVQTTLGKIIFSKEMMRGAIR